MTPKIALGGNFLPEAFLLVECKKIIGIAVKRMQSRERITTLWERLQEYIIA